MDGGGVSRRGGGLARLPYRGACLACWWNCRCCRWLPDWPQTCWRGGTKDPGSFVRAAGERNRAEAGGGRANSHAHLGVVDHVLQRVVAGEQVHHLLVVGDVARAGVPGTHHAWDGDILDAGEVDKHPGPRLLRDLRRRPGKWRKDRCSATSVSRTRSLYHHGAGADGNGFFCDGDVEFDNGRVHAPVGRPFALLFGVLGVEGQERLVVAVEIDGTQEDLQVDPLGATRHLDVGVS